MNSETLKSTTVYVAFAVMYLTHFEEPTLTVRIKKCQREVIPIILWDFERLTADARIQFLEDF